MTGRGVERARELLEAARGRRVLVLGDLILDSYLWGGVSRISPEAPVPVVKLARESQRLGGAANVAGNLAVLGARVAVAGVVGRDEAGERLVQLLGEAGIEATGVVEDPERPTIRKTRVIAQHQQVVRVDRESDEPLVPSLREELCHRLRPLVEEAEVVLVEDYDKGVVEEQTLEVLREVAAESGAAYFVDPKAKPPELYRGARCLTPNRMEVSYMTGRRLEGVADLEAAAEDMRARCDAEGVLVTLGEQGMLLVEMGREPLRIPALSREVFDVTGAGDTVSAVLALAAGRDGSLEEAARLAACAASVVVQRLGTVAPRPEEILREVESLERGA